MRAVPEEAGTAWVGAEVKPLWVFECEDEIRSSPTVYRGVVYVGAHDNNLYAVNANDGTFRWKYPAEGRIVATPAVAEEENLVVFRLRRTASSML